MELSEEMINRIEEGPSEAALSMLKKGYPTERVMASTGLSRGEIMKLIQPWIPDYVTQGLIPALLEIKSEDRKEGELWGKVKIMLELGFSHEQITEKIGLSGDALLDIQQNIKTETNPKVKSNPVAVGNKLQRGFRIDEKTIRDRPVVPLFHLRFGCKQWSGSVPLRH